MIFISELAYSLHLGSDKNRKNVSREKAKSNNSGTTSLPNSAIQNSSHLTRVDKHNYRKYDNKTEDIVIVRGTTSLVDDVKNLYKQEFQKSVDEYNSIQVREDRKIKDYFTNASNNTKNDLACEIIIDLGNKKYWDTKDKEFKRKMTNVFIKQVNDLELLVPNFKIASAIIHYDETSPHMHIVGVPIKYKNKYGPSIQVGKSDVFTKTSLRKLQDKMRILCIESFNQEYNQNSILKDKQLYDNTCMLTNYNRYDYSLLDSICDEYIYFSDKYNKLCSTIAFSNWCNISTTTIDLWSNNKESSPASFKVWQKLQGIRKDCIKDRAYDNKSPVGAMFVGNNEFGMNQPGIGYEATQARALTANELPQLGGANSQNIKALPSDNMVDNAK